ncbi:helix-turn-helix domain-containing protein [Neobacillus piezotolerans]|nr:helix-turn-helix transcriptional regulator [Neobacillus piezotolerans]
MEGNKIRKLRSSKGISLNKLSEITGISKSYLSLLERGIQKNPSLEIMQKLALSLDVDPEVLFRSDTFNSDHEGAIPSKKIVKLQVEFSEEDVQMGKYDRVKELLDIISNKNAK